MSDRGAPRNHDAGQAASPAEPRDEWQKDLNSDHPTSAALDDDERKQVPVLPEGTRLQQGATYVDLPKESGAVRNLELPHR